MANISFTNYPSSNRDPGVFLEITGENANTTLFNERILLIGQMLPSGNALPNIPVISQGSNDVLAKVGAGSMLYEMFNAYRAVDGFGEVWLLPVADNGAGTKATGTVAITGTATAGGTLNLYIGGTNVQVGVAVGDLNTSIATKLAASLSNYPNVRATATAVSGVVTFTATQAGLAAGDVDLRVNYLGAAGGETTPAGLTIVCTPLNGGTADPDFTAAFANCGDIAFDYLAFPYNSAAPLASCKAFLSEANGRWSWQNMLYGIAFNAFKGTLSATTTFGLGQNDKHITTLPLLNSPTSISVATAVYTAVCAASLRTDPALPLTQIALTGIQAPTIDQIPTQGERNTFNYSGISTFVVGNDGTVILQRAVTNYQKTLGGIIDNSWLDVETDATLAFIARFIRSRTGTVFARKKLANDGTILAGLNNVVTPSIVKNYVVALYKELEVLGYVQDFAGFAKGAVAENAGGGQVSLYLPIVLNNQLRVIAMRVAFTKP